MADFRPFSTPSPLLVFPSASPTSKLRCTPTRKPPSPIDWAEECHQGMLLEANGAHYHHHSRSHDEQNKNVQHFKDYITPVMMIDSTLRRHSTPDFMTLYHRENLPSESQEPSTDMNLVSSTTDLGFKSSATQSNLPALAVPSSNSSSNLSIGSSSTSSMSYISSMSSSEDDDDEKNNSQVGSPRFSAIMKPRQQRPRHVSMIHQQRRMIDYDDYNTGASCYSSSAQSISTTLREKQYHERFVKKKSKFSLLMTKMKRAAERPFRMVDGPG
ncbi:hypothetical protein BCR42DRAFT_399234 [Absidia repens]|uniref:Uncharacterized protein n=1 Tax=Absidia repens TaxID=90262 RepID=A0A1X2IZQ0_9FUNG|nr:hypothetical protein BCR42DRAFT_399234 [Absidia repens]